MKNKKTYLVTLIVLIIDIITKLLVSNLMIENQSIEIINNFFYLTYAKNTGIAFSLFEGKIPLVIILTIIIILVLIKYLQSKNLSKLETISYGLVIGGAIGNLIDRIVYGYVIDFIDIYIFSYDYPIFNIADIGVVLGIILILILTIKEESSDKNETNRRNKDKNR